MVVVDKVGAIVVVVVAIAVVVVVGTVDEGSSYKNKHNQISEAIMTK